jgi:hypothetical protein
MKTILFSNMLTPICLWQLLLCCSSFQCFGEEKEINTNKDCGGLIIAMVLIVLCCFCVGGYLQNVYKLTCCDLDAPYRAEVIRSVGIVVPIVGWFAGWMDLGL